MSIGLIDMDGTLCDYNNTMNKALEEIIGPEVVGHWYDKRYAKATDLIKKQPGFWRNLPRIELGFKIVEILKEFDFELHVLTKGPYRTIGAWSEKVEWCREHLPGVPVTITEDKSLVYGRVLVDDWPQYCEKWLRWRPRGTVIMPAYPYNEGFEEKFPGQVIRATEQNLDKVREVIERPFKMAEYGVYG